MTDFKPDHPEGVIVALDQMSLYFQATTTRVWSRRGQTPRVRVASRRDPVHCYGALDLCAGHESALTLPRQSGEMTSHFLNHLQSVYPGRALFSVWDRATWHQGPVVRHDLSQHPQLQTLHFAPGSPQLHPQEHGWELTRDAVSQNHTRQDFPALVRAFHNHLQATGFKFEWLEKYVPPLLVAT